MSWSASCYPVPQPLELSMTTLVGTCRDGAVARIDWTRTSGTSVFILRVVPSLPLVMSVAVVTALGPVQRGGRIDRLSRAAVLRQRTSDVGCREEDSRARGTSSPSSHGLGFVFCSQSLRCKPWLLVLV